jgi:hypothetical protein
MNGKCEIHRNQIWPVFYGTQQCVKVKSGTLIIIRKLKVWRTNGHEDPYIPPTLVERGYKKTFERLRQEDKDSQVISF